MIKGFSKDVVSKNTNDLIGQGLSERAALAKAVKWARNSYKRDHPDSVIFPKHLSPGNVYAEYKGGE